MKFGKYESSCVQELLSFYKYNYLRWIYFNFDKITFMDDILDELKIPVNLRIEKPGKCPDNFNTLFDNMNSKIYGLSRHVLKMKAKKSANRKTAKCENNELHAVSKYLLAAKNHGHTAR